MTTRWMITVDEERRMAVLRRAELWRKEERIDEDQRAAIDTAMSVPWVSRGVIASVALFLLTVLAVLAAGWFADEVLPFGERFFLGVVSLVLAEVLVRRSSWWSTGVEQALWLCGLFALILSLPGEGKPEALLLFAAAAFAAGARLRSAPLGALGVLIVAAYLEQRGHEPYYWRPSDPAAGFMLAFRLAAIALAVLAALGGTAALRREWHRPSSEWFWTAVVVLVPTAGIIASNLDQQRYARAAIALVLGATLVAISIAIRHHAPLLGGLLLGALAAVDVLRAEPVGEEVLLIAFGAGLLGMAYVSMRLLRRRTTGVVAVPMSLTVADDAVQTAGTFAAAPHHVEAPQPAGPEGGGSFGGAGATGEY